MTQGKRESEWHVLRRCLAIIRRIQRGPASWPELAEAVRLWEHPAAYGELAGAALQHEIQRDLRRIRDRLFINVRYNRQLQGYEFRREDAAWPLLDLPDEDLAIMTWLEQSFAANTPKHQEVSQFLRRLRGYLSEERLAALAHQRTLLHLNLGQRDTGDVPPELLDRLGQACDRRQMVEVMYDSLECEPGFLERHRLRIYELPYFDTERGHFYLRAWCEHFDYRGRRDYFQDYRYYRLDRVQQMEVLPLKINSPAPAPTKIPVVYRLSPAIARHELNYSSVITIETVETEPEGAKLVTGYTASVFWATRFLLHYGEACTVLGGQALRAEMERIVKEMARNYSVGA